MASLTFDDICQKLRDKENFSFARYGDGEWMAILGYPGANCDGHPFYADMGMSLGAVLLEEQRYYIGMQPKAQADLGEKIQAWIKKHGCKVDWCDADILHDASTAGRLGEFGDALRTRRVVVVGPPHLKPVADNLKAAHITVPQRKCWKWYSTIYSDLMDEIDKDIVVLYAMSMPTEVMMAQVAREFGNTVTQIDIGSVMDVYCGVISRRYHRQIAERLMGDEGN